MPLISMFRSHTHLISAVGRWIQDDMPEWREEYKGEETGNHWTVESEL